MPYKDRQKQEEFIRSVSRNITIRMMYDADKDILEWIKRQEHPTTSIKRVLREYLEKEKRES